MNRKRLTPFEASVLVLLSLYILLVIVQYLFPESNTLLYLKRHQPFTNSLSFQPWTGTTPPVDQLIPINPWTDKYELPHHAVPTQFKWYQTPTGDEIRLSVLAEIGGNDFLIEGVCLPKESIFTVSGTTASVGDIVWLAAEIQGQIKGRWGYTRRIVVGFTCDGNSWFFIKPHTKGG